MTTTENITVTHLTDQPQTDAPTIEAAPAATGVDLVHVPAADVVIEDNVRTAADLDPAFLASVKRHGVLLPTIGYRNTDGAVVVRDGQMRVLAAREAGTTVPVFVTARGDSKAARIAEQLVANERRTALTDGDRLAAYRQLEIEGLSVTAIARETGTKRDTVKQTLAVAKSEAATKAVTDQALTLDDALLFAEFQDDPEAIAELQACVDEGYADELPFTAERIRQDRQGKADMARITGEWEAKGVRVVTTEDDYKHLHELTDAEDDAEDRPVLDAEAHATGCAGHAVVLQSWGEHTAIPVCTTPEAHHVKYPRYSFQHRPGGGTDRRRSRRAEGGREAGAPGTDCQQQGVGRRGHPPDRVREVAPAAQGAAQGLDDVRRRRGHPARVDDARRQQRRCPRPAQHRVRRRVWR
ncbi:ParB/RepB/Spo0J family partition protein [Curtobacterium flaccumfaciens]|uniref:ParB/RepB/Spo0J family partition protein n=1 Tax=Curtobacterium flaccumfaciens TaxID=2035 RepID=UPI001BDE6677|nr:ParB N-terminal domain-containing protein [Curtobacterium flaccumfaciens]MBT1631471.1 ParB N-terminal domain-containing protein [Curtobacterium flaccumfaciens pv. oortii]MCX2846779.1 ParB N-terminal domain-containing protein [Curtobacterium flaccumfaciens pv. oortii]